MKIKNIILTALLTLFMSSVEANVRLYVFDCGHIYRDDISDFGLSKEETDVRELFVACYLIDHPNGKMTWDVGLPLDLVRPDNGRK